MSYVTNRAILLTAKTENAFNKKIKIDNFLYL